MLEETISLYNQLLQKDRKKKKVIYITPHLSTGGLPEVLRKRIELLKDDFDIYVVEFTHYGTLFDVQRNKILNMVPQDHFFTLGGLDEPIEIHTKKRMELINIISRIQPDVVHLEEIPELFGYQGFPDEVAKLLYAKPRDYVIYETSHDSGYDPHSIKKWFPDKFLFISKWHLKMYEGIDVPKEVIEYPVVIEKRPDRDLTLKSLGLDPSFKHVLNVGIFTPRKNQAEIFEIAKILRDEKILFHFIGTHAGNFEEYWRPLLKDPPSNCIVWGQRHDVDKFYSCMDLFLFTSIGSPQDRETNPVVLKEALKWQMPILMYNLEVYCGAYDCNPSIKFLSNDRKYNIELLLDMLDRYEDVKRDPPRDPDLSLFFDFYREKDHVLVVYKGYLPSQYQIKISLLKNEKITKPHTLSFSFGTTFNLKLPEQINKEGSDFKVEFYDTNNNLLFSKTFYSDDNVSSAHLLESSSEERLPRRAYITHSTRQYLPIVESLIKSLNEFSTYPIILYTINCDCNFTYPNLVAVRYDDESIKEPKMIVEASTNNIFVDRRDEGTYFTLTLKPLIIMNALSKGLEEGIYLDGDMIANHNVDDLFEYSAMVDNYPLVTEGIFEIMGTNDKFYIETPLMEKLGVTQRMWYRQTGIILFTSACLEFVEEWNKVCRDPEIIQDWYRYAPYHEETIINVLFWKYGYVKCLPQSFMSVVNVDTVKYFDLYDGHSQYDSYMRGTRVNIHTGVDGLWLKIPEKKEWVKVFHGVKTPAVFNEIIEYLKIRKRPLISIVMAYYKRPQQLISTLISIGRTNYYNVEIIVVDDGDNDIAFLEEFKKSYRFPIVILSISHHVKKWINPCIAYNIGLDNASGEYIIIQNPECVHCGDLITHCADNIEKNKYLIYSCCAFNTDESSSRLMKFITDSPSTYDKEFYKRMRECFYEDLPKEYRSILDHSVCWYHHPLYRREGLNFCTAIHKDGLKIINGFDDRFAFGICYDDGDLLNRIRHSSLTIEWFDEQVPFAIHLKHDIVQHGNAALIHEKTEVNRLLMTELNKPERVSAERSFSQYLPQLKLVETR